MGRSGGGKEKEKYNYYIIILKTTKRKKLNDVTPHTPGLTYSLKLLL